MINKRHPQKKNINTNTQNIVSKEVNESPNIKLKRLLEDFSWETKEVSSGRYYNIFGVLHNKVTENHDASIIVVDFGVPLNDLDLKKSNLKHSDVGYYQYLPNKEGLCLWEVSVFIPVGVTSVKIGLRTWKNKNDIFVSFLLKIKKSASSTQLQDQNINVSTQLQSASTEIEMIKKRLQTELKLFQDKEELYKNLIDKLEDKNYRLQNTLSFQLGHSLIFGFKSWKDFIRLPKKIIDINRLAKSNKALKSKQINKTQKSSEYLNIFKRIQALDHQKSDHNIATMPLKEIKKIKIAIIADEFTFNSFKFEFIPIIIEPHNWRKLFEEEKPDLFFCESAWSGIDSLTRPWKGKIYATENFQKENRSELLEILEYCKTYGIKTFFWNKEDPTHFSDRKHDFVKTAVLFDAVFTTAEECIESYKNIYGIKNVFVLPFATQPKFFNPIENTPRANKVVSFAGSWYANHIERSNITGCILDDIIKSGYDLSFYNRFYGDDDTNHMIPEQFKSYERPNVSHENIGDVYKSSKIALNINTVTESSTMFARRVFELMSCNTLVVSNYAKGVDTFFQDDVLYLDKNKHALEQISDDEIEALRRKNLKTVLLHHTYRERFKYILNSISYPYLVDDPSVTLVSVVRSEIEIKNIMSLYANLSNQPPLLFVLNEEFNDIDIPEIYNKINSDNIMVISLTYLKNYGKQSVEYIQTSHFLLTDADNFIVNVESLADAMLHISYFDNGFISLETNGAQYQILDSFVMQNILAPKNEFVTSVIQFKKMVELPVYSIFKR